MLLPQLRICCKFSSCKNEMQFCGCKVDFAAGKKKNCLPLCKAVAANVYFAATKLCSCNSGIMAVPANDIAGSLTNLPRYNRYVTLRCVFYNSARCHTCLFSLVVPPPSPLSSFSSPLLLLLRLLLILTLLLLFLLLFLLLLLHLLFPLLLRHLLLFSFFTIY